MKVEKKEKSNTVLVKVSDNNVDIVTCNFAIIPITEGLKKQVLFMKQNLELLNTQAKKENVEPLYKLTSFYTLPTFLSEEEDEPEICSDELVQEMMHLLNTKDRPDYVFVNDDFLEENKKEIVRTIDDATQLVVTNDSFHFVAYIKGTNVRMFCHSILIKDIL